MKNTVLTILFWILLVLGALSIFAGVSLPLFFSTMVDEALLNLWCKPSEYDQWGEVPGSNEIKLVRMFKIFNYTNVPDILNGNVAKIVEMPPSAYQEYTQWRNWTYENDNFEDLGQDDAGKYLGFNSFTNLSSIPNNMTEVNKTTPVINFNFLTYINFYALTHSAPPFYMVSSIYDAIMALENDFYTMILSYTTWKKFISDTSNITDYLTSEGFDASAIMNDTTYGWSQWQTLKPWIQAILDYNTSQTYNTYETLNMHFQEPNLIKLINSSSLLYEKIHDIQTDMQTRYGTNNPKQLGILQWSTGSVTLNLPMDLGTLSIPGAKSPLPSFIMMNTSFTSFPEVFYFQLAFSALNYTKVSFKDIAANMLELWYTYPKQNIHSLANLNNLAVLFTNPAAAMSTFGFTNPLQVEVISKYLAGLIYTPVPKYNVTFDGYSLFLSRLSRASLVTSVNNMINDAYWSIPTLIIFNTFKNNGTTCSDFLSQANFSSETFCSSTLGFDITKTNTWYNLMTMIKATFKGKTSTEYSQILTYIPSSNLNTLLSILQDPVTEALKTTSSHYKCSKLICTFEETLYLQWSSGGITSNLPIEAQGILLPSPTLQNWLPTRYLTPIEWNVYNTTLPALPLAPVFLSYSAFLNPGTIRYFYNMYFTKNTSEVQAIFGLPNPLYVEALYNYLLKIIPGLTFFRTLTYQEWILGFYDPFVAFAKSLGIYGGGMPTLSPYGALATNSSEAGKPRSVVESGRLNTGRTKFYKKYMGSFPLKKYGMAYDEYSSTMTSPAYTNIWAKDINVTGGDGGQYGTKISDNDILEVFVSPIMRMVNLTYDHDFEYHGLSVSHFITIPTLLNTSDKVPVNADFYQNPNGFDGFMNMSAQYGVPAFVNLMHCFRCSEEALKMVEYYKYEEGTIGTKQILPSESDMPYADVEPLTGSGVRVFLNYEFRMGVYNDYFFKGFYEPVPGKGVYFPVYTFIRQFAMTGSQVDQFFGDMQFVQEFRKYMFFCGIITGCAMIVLALVIGVALYRRNKFDTWKSRRNTVIKKYVRMGTNPNELRTPT